MSFGYLQASKPTAFNKRIHKFPLLSNDKGDIILDNSLFSGVSTFEGYICHECDFITFNFSSALEKRLNE